MNKLISTIILTISILLNSICYPLLFKEYKNNFKYQLFVSSPHKQVHLTVTNYNRQSVIIYVTIRGKNLLSSKSLHAYPNEKIYFLFPNITKGLTTLSISYKYKYDPYSPKILLKTLKFVVK